MAQVATHTREGIGGTGGVARMNETDIPTQVSLAVLYLMCPLLTVLSC
jgi:hypothetical protein